MTRPARTSQPGSLTQTITLTPESGPDASVQEQQPTFWERIYSIAPEDWSKYFIYLYRGRGGANLEKIPHPIDPDWVKQKYGGGDYRAILHDEKHRIVAAQSFSIEGPPKPAANEAQPAAPQQSDAFQAQVLNLIQENQRETQNLLRQLIGDRDRRPASGDLGDGNPIVLKGVVDMFTGMLPKQNNLVELLTLLKTLIPAQEKMDLLAMLKGAKELGLIPSAAPGGDLLGQVDSLLAVAEKLGARAGGRAPGVLEILAEKAPEIVERAGSIMDKWAKAAEQNRIAEEYRFARTQAVTRTQHTPLPPGTTITAPANPHVQPSPGNPALASLDLEPVGTPAPQTPATAATGPAAGVDDLDRIKQKIVEAIANGNTGADIVSFIDVMDRRLVDTFVGVSEKDLAGFFLADPVLSQAQKLPRFSAVMQEIVEVLNTDEDLPDQKPN